MANYVYTHISVIGNEEALKKYEELVLDKFEKMEGEKSIWALMMTKDEWTYGDAIEKVGAKWAYADDYDFDSMHVVSAWSPVQPFCEWLSNELGKVDPDVRLEVTYEDEFPNYIGAAGYDAEGEYFDETMEWDEVQDLLIEKCPELRDPKHWDEEEEEYTDEGEELMRDVMWEIISDWQFEIMEANV